MKITNVIVYIIVFSIILASFIIPNKLFEKQELNFEISVYEENYFKENTINVEAEEIYLVKVLHDIESENIGVTIGYSEISESLLMPEEKVIVDDPEEKVIVADTDENSYKISNVKDGNSYKTTSMKNEIKTLEQYNILEEVNDINNSKLLIRIINKKYQKDKLQYIVNNVTLNIDDQNYQFDMEEKTGKIIRLIINKKNLNNNIDKQELLENYIKYLDLDIIDDWIYENNMMKSKKAELTVSLIESVNDGICLLSIHSNDKILGNLTEYVIAEK